MKFLKRFLVGAIALFSISASAETWTKLTPAEHQQAHQANPKLLEHVSEKSVEYCIFRLNDFEALKKVLLMAPPEPAAPIISEMPMSDGTVRSFQNNKTELVPANIELEYGLYSFRGVMIPEEADKEKNTIRVTQQVTIDREWFYGQALGFVSKNENRNRMIVEAFGFYGYEGKDLYLAIMLKTNNRKKDSIQCQ